MVVAFQPPPLRLSVLLSGGLLCDVHWPSGRHHGEMPDLDAVNAFVCESEEDIWPDYPA